jgi:hypothetical protein
MIGSATWDLIVGVVIRRCVRAENCHVSYSKYSKNYDTQYTKYSTTIVLVYLNIILVNMLILLMCYIII